MTSFLFLFSARNEGQHEISCQLPVVSSIVSWQPTSHRGCQFDYIRSATVDLLSTYLSPFLSVSNRRRVANLTSRASDSSCVWIVFLNWQLATNNWQPTLGTLYNQNNQLAIFFSSFISLSSTCTCSTHLEVLCFGSLLSYISHPYTEQDESL